VSCQKSRKSDEQGCFFHADGRSLEITKTTSRSHPIPFPEEIKKTERIRSSFYVGDYSLR
jgi:hypothetical protein